MSTPVCVVEHAETVSDGDASTVLDLVCRELAKRGIAASVAPSADGAGTVYRVRIRSLGEVLFLELEESRGGAPTRSARIRLRSLDQAIEGAPRVVAAMLDDIPVEATATNTTLTEQDTRRQLLKPAPIMVGFGVSGTTSTISFGKMGYGIDGQLGYFGPRYGAGFHARINGGSTDAAHLAVFGRRYLGDGDVAPFVGLGLAIARYGVLGRAKGGLSGQLELGVETMRFSSSRLGLMLNVDVPTFALSPDGYDVGNRYGVFFGLGAYFAFGRSH